MAVTTGDVVAFRSSCKSILKWIDVDIKDLKQSDLDKAIKEIKAMLHICQENLPR